MLANYITKLPNPHSKFIRELLNCLATLNNDYERLNIALRNIQNEFKRANNEFFQLRKLEYASEVRLNTFQTNLENDTATKCFTKQIEDIQRNRQNIVEQSKKIFYQLTVEKTKFNHFHYKTINYLKDFIAPSNDTLGVQTCEKKINEINNQFARELVYIQKCEFVLGSFFLLLHESKCRIDEYHIYKNYDWVLPDKSTEAVTTISNDIKNIKGNYLRKAFANLHIHGTGDREMSLTKYLLTMELNDINIKEKMKSFM